MNAVLLFSLVALMLFFMGLYGFFAHAHMLRKILTFNIMGNAVFMLFIAIAARDPLQPDPVPHALVLTGIVIAVSATAFALALARQYFRKTGAIAWDSQGKELKS